MIKPWHLLQTADEEVFKLIEAELSRQRHGLELIASENFASLPMIAAMGNVLTNKYAEGLPGKRYYGGCEFVDELESIAINRAGLLFQAKFANVQPHSGAQANAAVLLALASPGDKILGMDLSHGGHLTHGSKVNFSGILYESHFYSVNADGRIDYDIVREQALKIRPKVIIAGASAYPRQIDFARFAEIAKEVSAYLMVDMAHIAGLVAAGLHPSPVPYADVVTTTTHKTLRGPRGGLILCNDEEIAKKINKAVFPGTQGGPLEHIIAAKAICFKEAMREDFITYQKQVITNAKALAAGLVKRGFELVSGGSDNHLMLIDLSRSDISGKMLEEALGQIDITVNKNTVPGEKRSPFVTSGVRIGTPAVTTRGMGVAEMEKIAELIFQCYSGISDAANAKELKKSVRELSLSFPLYPEWG